MPEFQVNHLTSLQLYFYFNHHWMAFISTKATFNLKIAEALHLTPPFQYSSRNHQRYTFYSLCHWWKNSHSTRVPCGWVTLKFTLNALPNQINYSQNKFLIDEPTMQMQRRLWNTNSRSSYNFVKKFTNSKESSRNMSWWKENQLNNILGIPPNYPL